MIKPRAALGEIVTYILRYDPFQTPLITLGAFVTTAALVLDIFSQQIVLTQTRMVADHSGIARVSWAQTANGPMYNAEMVFYEGLRENKLEDLPTVCSSGNCTCAARVMVTRWGCKRTIQK